MPDTVYLLHFSRPLGNPANRFALATHYLGTAHDLGARLAEHRVGQGARITAAAVMRGIEMTVAWTWPGGRALERRLKRRKEGPRLCPLCRTRARQAMGVA